MNINSDNGELKGKIQTALSNETATHEDLFDKVGETKNINHFLDYITAKQINIFLPDKYYNTAFHGILSITSDFK